jgi:site-specific DNA recombinase
MLIAADTGQDLTDAMQQDPMQKALVQIQAVIAELEKTMLVKKLRAARARKKAATGRCEGRKPYGYYDGELAIVETIRHLRRTKIAGKKMSLAKVAERLNAMKLPTRGGGEWRASVVGQIEKGPYWKKGRGGE